MVKHTKWLVATSTLVLSGSLLAGCGTTTSSNNQSDTQTNSASSSSTKKPVTITFYEAMPSKLGKELKKLTSDFESQNPNIKVKLTYTGSYSTQKQKLTAAIAAHKAPTIAQVQETWETEYYNNQLLQPVGSLLSSSTVSDLVPIWKADNSYNGKLVSIPFNKSAYVLYYNTEDLKKAGIASPPTTWSQLKQDAVKIKQKTGIPGLGIKANWYTFEMLLHQAGGKDLTSNQKKSAFDNAAGKSALTFMHSLVSSKAATVVGQNSYLSDGFNTNKYAMDLDTVAAMSFLNNPKTKWKVAPLPKGTQAAMPTSGTNIVLFKSASAAQQKAAAKYLEFLISKKNTIQWAEATGYLPVRESALNSQEWKSFIAKHPNKGVAPNDLKNAFFSPRLAGLYSGENSASTQISNYISGSQSESTTMQNMKKAIDNALAGN